MNHENDDQDRNLSDLAETLERVLSHAANEPLLTKRMEPYLSPRPANIYTDEAEAKDLERHIHKFLDKIEPQQKLIITRDGELHSSRDRIRTYQFDISNELTDCFHVCRNAVCRLHMFYITHENVKVNREFWVDMSEEDTKVYGDLMAKSFWEALEIATVRLVSYWDRVGQLLDFVFFNIRQYERDGFPAVVERIKKNFATTFPDLASDASYKAFVEYTNSEKPVGFKWLTRRRNLAIHSTRFRPHEDTRDAMFEYEFNHFETRVIRNLALKSPKEELELIHAHLAKAAELFRGVFELASLGLDLIKEEVNSRGQ